MMVSFYVYDVIFLVLFTLGVVWFLKTRHSKNLSREGWMFMYRTQFGVKAMKWFDDKFHKQLGYLRYVIVTVGFILMFAMIYLLMQTVWIYISQPLITEQIKAPPVAPLIPYFPELFGLRSLFPPFYFTYFLVALAVVAIVHEFSHGIYMRYSKTKIKSTGLVFLGPILGAFVEEDQKSFYEKNRFNQMSVLGAGVFANVLFAILFYLLYVGFFYVSFAPAGFTYNGYYINAVNASLVDSDSIFEENGFVVFDANGSTFYLDDTMKGQLDSDQDLIIAYYDAPMFKLNVSPVVSYGGRPTLNKQLSPIVITAIDGKQIYNEDSLKETLAMYGAYDSITLDLLVNNKPQEHTIVLAPHPEDSSKGYLGIGYTSSQRRTIVQRFLASLANFRIDSTYYAPRFKADIVYFVYYLLWWVMIINLLVALFNMLPLGILDGGRFFYLAVEKVFNKKTAEFAFKWSSKIIFGIFILLLLIWLFRIL